MVEIPATIERHLRDTLFLRALRDQLTEILRAGDVAAHLHRTVLFRRRGRRHGLAFAVVDHLRVNMLDAAEYSQTRALGSALHLGANTLVNAGSALASFYLSDPYFLPPAAPVLPCFLRSASPV